MILKEKLNNIITGSNRTTGENDTNVTDCVNHLIEGYGGGGGSTIAPILYFFQSVDSWGKNSDNRYNIPDINRYDTTKFNYSDGIFTCLTDMTLLVNLGVAQYRSSTHNPRAWLYNGNDELIMFTEPNEPTSGQGTNGVNSKVITFHTGDTFRIKKVEDFGWCSPQLIVFDVTPVANVNMGDTSALDNVSGAHELLTKLTIPYTLEG